MRPQPAHAGEVVLELGQLDLELALGRVGVVGEDVEDHGGAVDHGHPERRLQVALLARRELVVDCDQVGVAGRDLLLQLGELAAPEVAVGVRAVPLLDHLAGGGYPGGAKQLLQLGEGVAGGAAVAHPDRHRALAGAGIGDARRRGARGRLCVAAVAGALHSP